MNPTNPDAVALLREIDKTGDPAALLETINECDHLAMLAYADILEEAGGYVEAEAWRWLSRNKKVPYGRHGQIGCFWWDRMSKSENNLPSIWHDEVILKKNYPIMYWFPTPLFAYQRAVEGYTLLTQEQQQDIQDGKYD